EGSQRSEGVDEGVGDGVGVEDADVLAPGKGNLGPAGALVDGAGVGFAAGTTACRRGSTLKTLSKTGAALVKLSLIVPRAFGEIGWYLADGGVQASTSSNTAAAITRKLVARGRG